VPHIRPGIAQLAFLHVTAPLRAIGIGGRLCKQLEQIAGTATCMQSTTSAADAMAESGSGWRNSYAIAARSTS
jgi:hypothetical protein